MRPVILARKSNASRGERGVPGEAVLTKTAVARRKFTHLGKLIEKGETIEADSETILELAHQRLVDPFSITGGSFTLELMSDNWHKISAWDASMGNLAGEPWYRVEFLVDVSGLLVKAGDKRRLKTIARA